MTKKLKKTGLLFLALVLLASCNSSKPALTENKTQTITITETVHDTVFKIEKDSSSYNALLQCQNGIVMIKDVTQAETGRRLKSPRVRVENNKLSVDCEINKQELYAFWKSKQVKEVEFKTINTTKFVNQLTFWQKLQIWLGRIFLIVMCYYVVRFVLKFYRPI
jgi:hypothetical protein